MGQTSQLNSGALNYATKLYLADSALTPLDRVTLVEFLQFTQTTSRIIVGATAAVVGGVAGYLGSSISPVMNRSVYKYSLSALCGSAVFFSTQGKVERIVWEYRLPQLKKDGLDTCYEAVKFYRGIPLRQQIEFYRMSAMDPEQRVKDPRKLGDGKFDDFMNGLRDVQKSR